MLGEILYYETTGESDMNRLLVCGVIKDHVSVGLDDDPRKANAICVRDPELDLVR